MRASASGIGDSFCMSGCGGSISGASSDGRREIGDRERIASEITRFERDLRDRFHVGCDEPLRFGDLLRRRHCVDLSDLAFQQRQDSRGTACAAATVDPSRTSARCSRRRRALRRTRRFATAGPTTKSKCRAISRARSRVGSSDGNSRGVSVEDHLEAFDDPRRIVDVLVVHPQHGHLRLTRELADRRNVRPGQQIGAFVRQALVVERPTHLFVVVRKTKLKEFEVDVHHRGIMLSTRAGNNVFEPQPSIVVSLRLSELAHSRRAMVDDPCAIALHGWSRAIATSMPET